MLINCGNDLNNSLQWSALHFHYFYGEWNIVIAMAFLDVPGQFIICIRADSDKLFDGCIKQ